MADQDFVPYISGQDFIPYVLNHKNAKAPRRGTPGSAGLDLSACEDGIVREGERKIVKTGVSMAIPFGWYGRVAPRSSLAVKFSVDVGGGVIDSDYRGDIGVVLINHGFKDFEYKAGDRIAQLVVERCSTLDAKEVCFLVDTERGVGGYGSTGV